MAIERKAQDLDERIEEYRELTKPIPPSEAIGRVSRMDAINNKSVNEAALRQAEKQRQGLDRALQRLDDDRFGLCAVWRAHPHRPPLADAGGRHLRPVRGLISQPEFPNFLSCSSRFTKKPRSSAKWSRRRVVAPGRRPDHPFRFGVIVCLCLGLHQGAREDGPAP